METIADQVARELVESLAGRVRALAQEASDEALIEAKGMLKQAMVAALLRQVLDGLSGVESASESPRESDAVEEQAGGCKSQGVLAGHGEQRSGSPEECGETVNDEVEPAPGHDASDACAWRAGQGVQGALHEQEPAGSSPAAETEEVAYYVYAVVEADGAPGEVALPPRGIDPRYPVFPVGRNHIRALVSRVSLQEFGQESLDRQLEDAEWLRAKVLAHQAILEQLSATHTLVPIKFCTIYRDEARVGQMLAEHHDPFVGLLGQLRGASEWGVKAYCDAEALRQWVERNSERILTLRAGITDESSGAAFFRRKRLERDLEAEAEKVADEVTQRVHDALSRQSEAAVLNPLQSREASGKDKDMALNAAYLVADSRLAEFKRGLMELAQTHEGMGFAFDLTGPWPPYNFSVLQQSEGESEPVDGEREAGEPPGPP